MTPTSRSRPGAEPVAEAPADRFRHLDAYRARREWSRYEGTPQRELFRTLRERFLERHSVSAGWAVDLGSGPGRFLARLGTGAARRVAVDLSSEMLNLVPEAWSATGGVGDLPHRVRADALHPPFADRSLAEVALVGNTAGFAGGSAEHLVTEASRLVASGGKLLLEVAPGPGERSRYLTRLPTSSLVRLLRAPVGAVAPRIEREGFRPESLRRPHSASFHRFEPSELIVHLTNDGFDIDEVLAVAPLLGSDAGRIASVRADPKSWAHLLELEERTGREPARWPAAAAVLVAATSSS